MKTFSDYILNEAAPVQKVKLAEARSRDTDVENEIRNHLSGTPRKTTSKLMYGGIKRSIPGLTQKDFNRVWKSLVDDKFLVKTRDGLYSWELSEARGLERTKTPADLGAQAARSDRRASAGKFNEKKWSKDQWAKKTGLKWWEKKPESLRAEIYHSKGMLPPSNWNEWPKIVDQLNSNPGLKQHGGKAPAAALKKMRNYKGKK